MIKCHILFYITKLPINVIFLEGAGNNKSGDEAMRNGKQEKTKEEYKIKDVFTKDGAKTINEIIKNSFLTTIKSQTS